MAKNIMARAAVTGMLLGAFTVGYFDGSVSQQRADAQGLGGILDRLPFSAARGIGEVNGEGGTGSQGQAPCHLKCRILSPEIPARINLTRLRRVKGKESLHRSTTEE